MQFSLTQSVLDAGIAARAFPAAVIEAGRASGPSWSRAFGHLSYDADSPTASEDTIFDLASLTKVVATTTLVMRQVADGQLDLDRPIADINPAWAPSGWSGIRVAHLLDHSSGLPAHAWLGEHARGRRDIERRLLALQPEAPPGARSVYSDIGFILLGFLLEDLAGRSLEAQMDELADALDLGAVRFLPPPDWLPRTAPTEFDSWRNRLLTGEVHDENAAALGGVAGHAGLFGTAAAVGRFARVVLRALRGDPIATAALPLMRRFALRTGVPGSSRALGWDTMLPTSSCGRRLSPVAIGHTGFTGTSLWIDPAQDLYVVLLTNRVHPSRANEQLRPMRARVHEAVVEDIERSATGAT